ncbi:GQ68_03773T0 [Komagataella phaffii GS115]|nr:GQ68_03773T0 [Komagataella phaffii GS115]
MLFFFFSSVRKSQKEERKYTRFCRDCSVTVGFLLFPFSPFILSNRHTLNVIFLLNSVSPYRAINANRQCPRNGALAIAYTRSYLHPITGQPGHSKENCCLVLPEDSVSSEELSGRYTRQTTSP